MPYDTELTIAREALAEAAGLCARVQAALDPELSTSKQDASPVSVADYAAQALVCRRLQAAFPDDPVIGEETAAALRGEPALLEKVVAEVQALVPGADADAVCAWIDRGGAREPAARAWTLDPIDGTKGFLRGDQYAVGLALLEDGVPVFAAVAAPNLDGGVFFHAARGAGAWAEPLQGGDPQAMNVRSGEGLLWCESVSPGHQDHVRSARVADALGATEGRRIDSMVKYALVARGDLDLLLRIPRAPRHENTWDHAAGCLLVTEAGGTVTHLDGSPPDFTGGPTLAREGGLIASSGARHEEVLAAIRAAMNE